MQVKYFFKNEEMCENSIWTINNKKKIDEKSKIAKLSHAQTLPSVRNELNLINFVQKDVEPSTHKKNVNEYFSNRVRLLY